MSKLKYIFDTCRGFGFPEQHLWLLYCRLENDSLCLDTKQASELQDFVQERQGKWILTQRADELIRRLDDQIKGKTPKRKPILIPQVLLEQYREMFPNITFPTGKRARAPLKAIQDSFQRFFVAYPDYQDWDTILAATQMYLQEYEAKQWEYCSTSQYFIAKMRGGIWCHILAEYYERILNGEHPEEPKIFETKFA